MAYVNLGALLSRFPDLENEAAIVLRRAIELDPQNASAYHNLGVVLANLDQTAEAEDAYRHAIEYDPGFADAHSALGVLLMKLNRYEEAERAFRQAIECVPGDSDAHFNLGLMLKRIGRAEEAIDAFRRSFELDPSNEPAYCYLSGVFWQLGRTHEAETVFQLALEHCEHPVFTYCCLGTFLSAQNRFPEAETAIRKAILVEPQDAAAHLELGLLLSQDPRRLGEAEEALTKAAELGEVEAFCQLAYLASKRHDIDGALKNLRLAAQARALDTGAAWSDPDLEWIRDDPRFREIVGPRPEK